MKSFSFYLIYFPLFNIQHKQRVSTNDSWIVSRRVSSLLLTYIDLWNGIGAKTESELTDDDWIFLFEDDVNIVGFNIIEKFYPQIYAKWNHSNSNNSLAGLNRFLIMKNITVCLCLCVCAPHIRQKPTVNFFEG